MREREREREKTVSVVDIVSYGENSKIGGDLFLLVCDFYILNYAAFKFLYPCNPMSFVWVATFSFTIFLIMQLLNFSIHSDSVS